MITLHNNNLEITEGYTEAVPGPTLSSPSVTRKKRKIMLNKFKKSHGGREHLTSVKYKKDLTNDCAIRAVTHAIYQDPDKYFKSGGYMTGYEIIRDKLFEIAKELCRMPNDDIVVDTFMDRLGYKKHSPLTHHGKKKYKIGNFPLKGTYLIRCSRHWTCLKDGAIVDTWDCRDWKAQSYYTLANSILFDPDLGHYHVCACCHEKTPTLQACKKDGNYYCFYCEPCKDCGHMVSTAQEGAVHEHCLDSYRRKQCIEDSKYLPKIDGDDYTEDEQKADYLEAGASGDWG